jgi:TolA-binding protein
MKRLYFITVALSTSLAFMGCGNKQQSTNQANSNLQDTSRQAYIDGIVALQGKLKNTSIAADAYTYNLAITQCLKFASKFPSDTLTPVFLFYAGNAARTINQSKRALAIYDNICTKYPNYKRIPDCIFVEGFIYDNDLKDTANAHVKYQEIINKYPTSEYAPQAKAAIAALGKSPDELVKEFEEKAKKQGNKPPKA